MKKPKMKNLNINEIINNREKEVNNNNQIQQYKKLDINNNQNIKNNIYQINNQNLEYSRSYKTFRNKKPRFFQKNVQYYNPKFYSRNIKNFNYDDNQNFNTYYGQMSSRGYNSFISNDLNNYYNNNNRFSNIKMTFRNNPVVVKLRGGTKIILKNDKRMNHNHN